jgi:type II secretory pathway predicted ATPase ExeA
VTSPADESKVAAESKKMLATVFPLSGDPKRVWLSGRHREVLKTLEAAIQRGSGVLLLTGETGSGKTVLTRALLDELAGTNVRVGRLPFPDLEPDDFYTVLAEALPGHPAAGADVLGAFRRFLDEVGAQGQRALLVVDEAQALRPELFPELLRLLEADAHANADPKGVFNVLLVGQGHLETILGDPQHAALAKLIRVRCTLRPLTANEVAGYVRYHLDVAGLDPNWFTPEAMEEICTRSRGIPRLINIVCDRTLQAAFDSGAETVDASLVAECAGEEIPEPGSANESVAAEEGGLPERIEDLVEAEPARRWTLVRAAGGVALLSLTIAAGVLVYLSWRSPSQHPTPPTASTNVEQAPPRPDTIAPAAGIASEPPPASSSAGRSPAAVTGKTNPEPAATITTAPSRPRATITAEPPAVAPEPAAPKPPAGATPSPPSARAPVTVKGGSPVTVKGGSAPAGAPEKASRTPTPSAVTPPPARGAAAAGAAPLTATPEEPDPAAIIDWLLKQSPRRPE